LKAADTVLSEGISQIVLIGNEQDILKKSESLGLKNIPDAKIVDSLNHSKKEEYAKLLAEIRKSKGMTIEEAMKVVENPLYLACLMIKAGDADGEVAGSVNSTGDVLRPAFQIIKTAPGIRCVSGTFLMVLKDNSYGDNGIMFFADCAVNPNPDAEQLAGIAISTAKTAKDISGMEPKVAMLSFSTKGSAKHELVDKVREATRIAKELDPNLEIDGELQADAAIVEKVAAQKAPDSSIAGKANVLVFPDLQSGNIGYKLVQRLAGAEAVGPILQGIAAPVNDLSRGCSVDDIINTVAITANQA
jgi:phosphate acetyltransferase